MIDETANRIAALNDSLRTTFTGGHIMLTPAIAALSDKTLAKVLEAVQTFTDFEAGNDPYAEHDFGSLEIEALKIFWKIEYYDLTMEAGAEDPADPEQTVRVLTIMLASEY